MRYKHGVTVVIPYVAVAEDGENEHIYAKMSFKGDVDRRRVKREIRKWVKKHVGRSISWELPMIVRKALVW